LNFLTSLSSDSLEGYSAPHFLHIALKPFLTLLKFTLTGSLHLAQLNLYILLPTFLFRLKIIFASHIY